MSDQKRAILAIVLSLVVLLGWQYFFSPKTASNTPVSNPISFSSPSVGEQKLVEKGPIVDSGTLGESQQEEGINENFTLTSRSLEGNLSLKINKAGGVVDLVTKRSVYFYENIVGENFISGIYYWNGQKFVAFNFSKKNIEEPNIVEDNISLTAPVKIYDSSGEKNETVFLNIGLDSKRQLSTFQFKFPFPLKIKFLFKMDPESLGNGASREFSLLANNKLEKFTVGDEKEFSGKVKWFGPDFKYHLLAWAFSEDSFFNFKFFPSGQIEVGSANFLEKLEGEIIFTKKNYDDLLNLGKGLHLSVDFGIWGILAVPILKSLQFLYSLIPNYGWSIILLTIFIRLLTFPLQIKSFKSMKKMEQVKPQVEKLKEKYKEDPQKLQIEMMSVYKNAGVNPLGGCLPLLLQMPIFFALYKVLSSAVELVNAPFLLWIQDLSAKDSFYVLPVLMGLSMFLQQKITPSAGMDPTQKKIMLFMPIIFSFFMKDLPAGLNLYMFVSTIFGMGQQLAVYKYTK